MAIGVQLDMATPALTRQDIRKQLWHLIVGRNITLTALKFKLLLSMKDDLFDVWYYECFIFVTFRFGSDKLKREYLVPSIAGEMVACLGVSEPNAGSDVASQLDICLNIYILSFPVKFYIVNLCLAVIIRTSQNFE